MQKAGSAREGRRTFQLSLRPTHLFAQKSATATGFINRKTSQAVKWDYSCGCSCN